MPLAAAHWGAGTSLMLLAFLDVTKDQAVTLLTVAVALESGTLAGYIVNHVDLSPNFGGAMMGVTNSIANIMGIIAPIFVSQIVGDAETSTEEVSVAALSRRKGACGWLLGSSVLSEVVLRGAGRAVLDPEPHKRDLA